MTREEMIAEEIKKNKEVRRKKYTTPTTFKKGMAPIKGCGRKKGSKIDPKKVALRELRKGIGEILAEFVVRIKIEDFDKLSLKDQINGFATLAKIHFDDQKSVAAVTGIINKIEVQFVDKAKEGVIDIGHEEVSNENSEDE